MDIHNLSVELKFANRIGATLSVEERGSLELAVLKLSEDRQFDRWNFWGRVEGLARNYYIVQGVNSRGHYEFPEKTYFWWYEPLINAALNRTNLRSFPNLGKSSKKKHCTSRISLRDSTRRS